MQKVLVKCVLSPADCLCTMQILGGFKHTGLVDHGHFQHVCCILLHHVSCTGHSQNKQGFLVQGQPVHLATG